MRHENPRQTIEEFEVLGHKAKPVKWGLKVHCECAECGCWLGSQDACNPCGDPLGNTINTVRTPHADYYHGKLLS